MFDFPPLFIIDSSMLHSIIRHLAYSELLRAILGQGAGAGRGRGRDYPGLLLSL